MIRRKKTLNQNRFRVFMYTDERSLPLPGGAAAFQRDKHLLVSGLYRRYRNYTGSASHGSFADFTAGREILPAPKIIFQYQYIHPEEKCQAVGGKVSIFFANLKFFPVDIFLFLWYIVINGRLATCDSGRSSYRFCVEGNAAFMLSKSGYFFLIKRTM